MGWRRAIASRKAPLCRLKLYSLIGRVVSQVEAPFSWASSLQGGRESLFEFVSVKFAFITFLFPNFISGSYLGFSYLVGELHVDDSFLERFCD